MTDQDLAGIVASLEEIIAHYEGKPSTIRFHRWCTICHRKLVHHTETTPDDPAIDCGGDCWGCIEEIEAWCRDDG